jgi:hypothetical protein
MRQQMDMALARIARIERHANQLGDRGPRNKSADSSVLCAALPTWARTSIASARVLRRSA